MVDVKAVARNGGLGDGVLRLFFGADEQEGLAFKGHLADFIVGGFELFAGLVEVDDINIVARAIDEGFHLGIPLARVMPEVNSRFEQVFH